MAAAGWTFRLCDSSDRHPYIVVTDPCKDKQGCCLCINITDEANYHGDGFFLEPGCCSIVVKRSVLYYPLAFRSSGAKLDGFLACGEIQRLDDLPEKLLEEVADACRKTRHLEKGLRYLLHQ
jgi:hypothetical protein